MLYAICSVCADGASRRDAKKERGVVKKDHPAKKIALGALASLGCYLALNALLSLLLTRGAVGEGSALPCILTFAALSAFAGGKLAGYGCDERWLPPATAGAFWGVTALLGFLTNNTLEPSRLAQLALAAAGGGALGCVKRGKKRQKRTRRIRK